MPPTTLAILSAILWMVIVTFAVGMAAVTIIARAFNNKMGGGLADLILSPGLKVGDGKLPIVLIVSWLCWAVIGEVVIWAAYFVMRK